MGQRLHNRYRPAAGQVDIVGITAGHICVANNKNLRARFGRRNFAISSKVGSDSTVSLSELWAKPDRLHQDRSPFLRSKRILSSGQALPLDHIHQDQCFFEQPGKVVEALEGYVYRHYATGFQVVRDQITVILTRQAERAADHAAQHFQPRVTCRQILQHCTGQPVLVLAAFI